MKATIRSVLALLLSLCAAALPAAAQEGKAATFSNEQLEQIVAPIALYPDSLLTQVMMGSTYPLEIVEADRWVKQNKSLKGSALDSALKDKSWDPSVKSLCTVPDVLAKMSENLDWTQDLGDAFLGQKTQLMDSVQRMRGKAYEAGNLKTTEQQVVTQQPDKIIVIEQASPQVVYVPSYSPTVVYGAWSYPTYYYPADVRAAAGRLRADGIRRRHGRGRRVLGRLELGLGPRRRRHRRRPLQQLQPQHQRELGEQPDLESQRQQEQLAARPLAPQGRELPHPGCGREVRRARRHQPRIA